jgi:hypothetical protein
MYISKLFFGLPVDSELSKQLGKINPKILSLFIQEGENYLIEVKMENQTYLGKSILNPIDLSSLELLEANIYSLLKKLLPEYPFHLNSLILFPLQEVL